MSAVRVAVPVALLMLAGCAGMSEQACLVADWQTIGFEDGAGGRPESTIGAHRQSCSKHGVTPDLESYRLGHAAGVETYCRASRGFEVGRSGAIYQGVCPAPLEPDFVAAYNSGRHLYELESALRAVDNQIASNLRAQENIKRQLGEIAAETASSETTTERRVELVARAAELGRRHGELGGENDRLRAQRVVHELDLRDYQQTLAFRF